MMRRHLSLPRKAALVARIWYWYIRVQRRLRRGDLAEVVEWLGESRGASTEGISPAHLGRIVGRALSPRLSGATCLLKSLVLFRLLHGRGFETELVVGLKEGSATHEAHAWNEIDGHDVGPPPGRGGFTVLARYRAGHRPSGVLR